MRRWGLIPYWAKDPAIGGKLINARVETAFEKPAFREAFKRRHALILADGFYEWRRERSGSKTPMFIRRRDRQPWAFAGLWERWRDPSGQDLRTFVILTGEPNDVVGQIHDRMPIILRREHESAWLRAHDVDAGELKPLLQPYANELMEAYPVSSRVNNVRNEGADLVEPVAMSTPLTLL